MELVGDKQQSQSGDKHYVKNDIKDNSNSYEDMTNRYFIDNNHMIMRNITKMHLNKISF